MGYIWTIVIMTIIALESASYSIKEMWKISVDMFGKWIDPVFTQ